jgi:hypothetical protein
MTSPITTSAYNYDNRAQRWRDSASGQFISSDSVNAEMFRHSDATHSTLENLTRQLYGGQISLSQWQIAVASELKDAHLAQAMFAAGGRANMGFAEFGRVGQTLREQYGFLNKFAADIASGKVSEAMALSRVAHYGDSSKASYWNEYIERSDGLLDWNDVPDDRECDVCPQIAAGGPYTRETIPSSPGDGKTPCRGRCRCTVTRRGER